MKAIILQRWLFKLGFLLVAIAAAAWEYETNVAEKITIAVIFLLVMFLIDQVYELHQYLEEIKADFAKHLDQLNKNFTQNLIHLTGVKAREASIAEAINKHNGPIKKSLKELHEDMTNALKINEEGFSVHNHSFAVSSYLDFWKALVDEQKNRPKGSGLTALVMHSCSIKIWLGRPFDNVLSLQRDFIEAGGSISRILCGKDNVPDKDYLDVARAMEKIGIEVTYYDIESGGSAYRHNFASDFLVIRELERAVIWRSDAYDMIEEALYLNSPFYNRESLVEKWMRLKSNSRKF
jgi:hypothetical protein